MRDNRYLEEEVALTADDLVRSKTAAGTARELVQAEPYQTVYHALRTMQGQDISQLPIFENGTPVGAIREDDVLQLALHGRDLRKVLIREVMGKPFPTVPRTASADQVTELITSGNPAVFIELGEGRYDIVTKYDIVRAVARLAEKESRG
jgi:cystathionine beta-synthase